MFTLPIDNDYVSYALWQWLLIVILNSVGTKLKRRSKKYCLSDIYSYGRIAKLKMFLENRLK